MTIHRNLLNSDNDKPYKLEESDREKDSSDSYDGQASLSIDETCPKSDQQGPWDAQEHQRFVKGLMKYRDNWAKVATVVESRNQKQTRLYANHLRIKGL